MIKGRQCVGGPSSTGVPHPHCVFPGHGSNDLQQYVYLCADSNRRSGRFDVSVQKQVAVLKCRVQLKLLHCTSFRVQNDECRLMLRQTKSTTRCVICG